MAGFSKIFCVGGSGGFQGADGMNPILFQILVGEADRQWLQAHYFDQTIKPIGKIETIIPAGPNDPSALLDACIAFFPLHFQGCPSLTQISASLREVKRLDFHLEASKIPSGWNTLRSEALPAFRELNIWQADLVPLTL